MNKRKILIYIAGPYSGDIKENIIKARNASIKIWNSGFTGVCPHMNTAHFEIDCKCDYQDYLEGDMEILKRCDGIFMLKDWMLSKGAREEHDLADARDMPIFYEADRGYEDLLIYDW